jgi:hypothetical protein
MIQSPAVNSERMQPNKSFRRVALRVAMISSTFVEVKRTKNAVRMPTANTLDAGSSASLLIPLVSKARIRFRGTLT